MKNEKIIKVLGIVTTVLGAGLSLVSSWVQNKELDTKINESVAKALAERNN